MDDKEKLAKALSEHVTYLFESVLDYAEVAVPNNDIYKKFRSKVLRVGNNCIRNIKKDIKNYNVEYEERELIVEYKQSGYDEREDDGHQKSRNSDKRGSTTEDDNIVGEELNIPEEWKNKR